MGQGNMLNCMEKEKYELIMYDDFLENKLNDNYWFPFYLPQWSSREASRPSYIIRDSILSLYISDEQKPWCPEYNGGVRVSNLQTGVLSGQVGSKKGQHHFKKGLVVREAQDKELKVAPLFGYIEFRAKCKLSKENVAALWLIGIEETREQSAEICIFELKGYNTQKDKAVIGYGVHPFGDTSLSDCFYEQEFDLNTKEWNVYAIDWKPDSIDFYINGTLINSIKQIPNYPMQLMLNLYDLENIKNENNKFEIDYVKVYQMNLE